MDGPNATPFDNIALAISGGGFRAAAYGLGTLSFLHQVPWRGGTLLERVSFMSSASGGSITNAFYTMRLYKGQAPQDIFHDLYQKLQGDTVLNAAVSRLHQAGHWQAYPHKHRNLINAFAVTYDQDIYDGSTLAVFDAPQGHPHVEEICIGSTELNNGQSFRFRMGQNLRPYELFGNHFIHFQHTAMDEIRSLRIGDVVAASSCFPLGFEPIVFPHDFYTGEGSPEALLACMEMDHNDPLRAGDVWQKPFGLIDGGVVDNQGLYGFEVADGHRKQRHEHAPTLPPPAPDTAQVNLAKTGEEQEAVDETQAAPPKDKAAADSPPPKRDRLPFSLCIISDVASYFLEPFKAKEGKWGALGKVPLLALVPAMLLAAFMPFIALALFWLQDAPIYDYILLVPGFFFTTLIFALFFLMGRALGGKFIDEEESPLMAVPLRTLRRHLLFIAMQPMEWWMESVANRRRSYVMLATSVFLKQIRRMYQNRLYGDAEVRPRLMSNFIYDLSRTQRERRDKELHKDFAAKPSELSPAQQALVDRLEPSAKVETTAEAARKVETTLWFAPERPQDLENVVATAQFTTCFNLIRHINRHEDCHGPLSEEMAALRETLFAHWERFQAHPHHLLDGMRKGAWAR